jgi:hypothetical protein
MLLGMGWMGEQALGQRMDRRKRGWWKDTVDGEEKLRIGQQAKSLDSWSRCPLGCSCRAMSCMSLKQEKKVLLEHEKASGLMVLVWVEGVHHVIIDHPSSNLEKSFSLPLIRRRCVSKKSLLVG